MSSRYAGEGPSLGNSARHLRAAPGLFVAPVAFALNLILTYALVPWACAHQQHIVLHLTELLFLFVALFGVWHGWRVWQAHRHATGSDAGDHASQEQLLGIVGTLASALFSLAMAAQWFTAFVVPACLS